MFSAVIFDWDGTLADTRSTLVTAFQNVLREAQCYVNDRFIERRIGIGSKRLFIEALGYAQKDFSPYQIAALVEKKIQIQLALSDNVKLFSGVLDLLEVLQRRIKIALATMSNRRVIDRLLDEKEIKGFFRVVVTADEIQHPKPNPEIFLKCAKRLSCLPCECVVVEDSPYGLIAAHESGMRSIAVSTGAYSKLELIEMNPDLLVESLEDKKTILNFILT